MLSDLETKGFCVIKNFINSDTLKKLQVDYINQLNIIDFEKKGNYRFIPSSYSLHEQIFPVLKDISKLTNINVNVISQNGTFWDTSLNSFDWHQDHESFYIWQDSYNALNFWIPIIKSDTAKSGLKLIPQDILLELFPIIYNEKIKGKGAKTIIPLDKKSLLIDDDQGNVDYIDCNIDTISVSPLVAPGDLLLFRQDVIHRTEDTDTHRVAISIRAYNGNTILYKDKILTGCRKKQDMIKNNPVPYKDIIEYFEKNNITECNLFNFFK